MRAGDELLGLIFNRDHRYVVPIFQRPYVWDERDNWIPLWHDLRRAVEGVERETHDGVDAQEYFLGAFVTQHQPPVPRRPSASMVIDGQQRMTTLQVFLAAACRAAEERGASGAVASLRTLILNRVAHDDHRGDEYKVTPLESDRVAYEWAVGGVADRSAAPDADHKLVRAAQFFDSTLRDWLDEADDPSERLDLLHFAIENRVKVVNDVVQRRGRPGGDAGPRVDD